MKSIIASTCLLMVFAVFGIGCAIHDRSGAVASDTGVTEFAADCVRNVRREFRNPNHRARRIYTTVRTNDGNCNKEEQP